MLIKNMPFFLLKNSLGARMKKGIKTLCNLNQQSSTNATDNHSQGDFPIKVSSPYLYKDNSRQDSRNLEDLILQLELEEEIAKKAKLNGYNGRLSCVNNSDILTSARNALNQYPRFSLDGRDAMYQSSFGDIEGRNSICCDRRLGGRLLEEDDWECKFKKTLSLPPTLAGVSVVWCKPGVVAQLMGLEAMPVPVSSKRSDSKLEKLSSTIKRQNLRRRFERHDLERRLAMETEGHNGIRRSKKGCCSRNEYCIMTPIALEQ